MDAYLELNVADASFQLLDYSASTEPIIREEVGRVGTRVTIEGEGEIIAASQAALSAAIAALMNSLDNSSGTDLVVMGIGGVAEFKLLSAQCIDGGPHCSVRMERQGDLSALRKRFSFTAQGAKAWTSGDGGGGGGGGGGGDENVSDRWHKKIAVAVDGLRTVTITGEIIAYAGYATAALELVNIPYWRLQYPAERWALTYESDSNLSADSMTYTLTFAERAEDMPAVDGCEIFDIEIGTDKDQDERGLITTTYRFDVSAAGDEAAIALSLRGVAVVETAPAAIVRTRVTRSRMKAKSLAIEFVALRGPDAAVPQLLEYEDEVDEPYSEDGTIKATEYFGVAPILTYHARPAFTATQSGRATAIGKFPRPAAPRFGDTRFAVVPRLIRRWLNQYVAETRWTYTFVSDSVNDLKLQPADLAKLKWPTVPADPSALFF